jgi:hypothetical protein
MGVAAARPARSRSREIAWAGRAGCRPRRRLRLGNAPAGQRCELGRLDRLLASNRSIFADLRPNNGATSTKSLLPLTSAVRGAVRRATRPLAQPLLPGNNRRERCGHAYPLGSANAPSPRRLLDFCQQTSCRHIVADRFLVTVAKLCRSPFFPGQWCVQTTLSPV